MIGTRTSSSYTPHVDVAPADRPLILVAPRWEEAEPFLTEMLSPNRRGSPMAPAAMHKVSNSTVITVNFPVFCFIFYFYHTVSIFYRFIPFILFSETRPLFLFFFHFCLFIGE